MIALLSKTRHCEEGDVTKWSNPTKQSFCWNIRVDGEIAHNLAFQVGDLAVVGRYDF